MKLWWPHDEILIASMMIFRDTGDVSYLEKFEQTLDYCKEHFSDREYGEWYGYLRRDGLPTQPSTKGFHLQGPLPSAPHALHGGPYAGTDPGPGLIPPAAGAGR